jgi:uncharacterized membrane protein
MREEEVTAHRLAAFSDAVFAVIVTHMVLELRAPDQPAFSALWLRPRMATIGCGSPLTRKWLSRNLDETG